MANGRRKKITLEEIQKRIKNVHGDTITIVPESYVGVRFKATFLDKDYGEWISYVTNVTAGHCHPKRGHLNSQKTNIEKYGSISPLGGKEIRKKIEATNLERYGCTNVLASESIKEKASETMIERYGFKNPQQVPVIREKTLQTNLEKYGFKHPYQSKIIFDKMKNDYFEKYGVENPFQLKSVRNKIKLTCLERYGVENPSQNSEIFKKTQRTKKQTKCLKHWKTGSEIICRGSYEIAVVNWLNLNQIDYDWQISFRIPDDINLNASIRNKVYNVDCLIYGKEQNTYVEIKGYWMQQISKLKWEWFHETHPNSELWTYDVLKNKEIL